MDDDFTTFFFIRLLCNGILSASPEPGSLYERKFQMLQIIGKPLSHFFAVVALVPLSFPHTLSVTGGMIPKPNPEMLKYLFMINHQLSM